MNGIETAPNLVRTAPRLLIGLAILAVGLLWTLDNLGVLEAEPITMWWPVVLVAIGAVRLLNPTAGRVSSALLILLGAALLLDTLDIWEIDADDLIPLLVVILGLKLVTDAFRRRSTQARVATADDRDSVVHAFALMSGLQRRSAADDFRGGDANAIMGGVELDLRNAQIRAGEEALIDVFAFWGGIEIQVPENWRVVGEVLPLMGSFIDSTTSTTNTGGPVLIVRGLSLMGGVEVKH